MDTVPSVFQVSLNATDPNVPRVHHILSGSFRSLSLFLLAFSPLHRTLSFVQEVEAFGPHQYLATNPRRNRVYTTSWAQSPILSSWEIERPVNGPWRVNHDNNVPITATSSYITIPPPYTHAYSAGGPTGEVHVLNPSTGAFEEKIQQILFVPEHELETADKTRVALRYGSHAIEFSPFMDRAFIPVLGTDVIEVYARNVTTGLLKRISAVPSPRSPGSRDGPRHLKIHPNGKILYCVTEHSNFVDTYSITPTSFTYLSSRSLLPSTISNRPHHFRGDTLLLAPSTPSHPTPPTLFATTRGSTPSSKGFISVFSLDDSGLFTDHEDYYETPTSGGKAHALDLLPKDDTGSDVWILLTDDDEDATAWPKGGNGVRILEWDGWEKGVKEVVGWPPPGEESEPRMAGGSHAIWLD